MNPLVREQTRGRFDDLLVNPTDPGKAAIRGQILYVLHSHGEILPSTDSVLGKLWSLINSPVASLDDCQALVELDPILTARIFRIANSASYVANASTISEAIFHLGFVRLREITFTAGVVSKLSALRLASCWDIFWLRNIFIARLAQRLSASFFAPDGTEYLAGLLHDLGWLYLIKYLPNLIDQITESPNPIPQAEMEVLPFSHADLSGALAARSGMPTRAVYAIFHHVKPDFSQSLKAEDLSGSAAFLGAILYLCDRIANANELNLFTKSSDKMSEILESAQLRVVDRDGRISDLPGMVKEELARSQELFSLYFN